MPSPRFTRMRPARPAIIALLSLLAAAAAEMSAQEYRYVETLGIHDAEHFSPRGRMYSFLRVGNDSHVRVGFYDAEHTTGGFQANTAVAINGTDALVGEARRFAADGSDLGIDAWVANLAGYTTRIGLTDAVHAACGRFPHASRTLMNPVCRSLTPGHLRQQHLGQSLDRRRA